MAIEEPVGFTADGKLVTCFRFTDAEMADMSMAGQMYAASPEAQDATRRLMDGLPSASITVSGYFE